MPINKRAGLVKHLDRMAKQQQLIASEPSALTHRLGTALGSDEIGVAEVRRLEALSAQVIPLLKTGTSTDVQADTARLEMNQGQRSPGVTSTTFRGPGGPLLNGSYAESIAAW